MPDKKAAVFANAAPAVAPVRCSTWRTRGWALRGKHTLLQKHGHVLLPLPPYSPDFNPIEQSGAMKKRRQGLPKATAIDELILSYS